MVRFLLLLIVLFILALFFEWLGSLPIAVEVAWPGGAIAPSFRVLLITLLLTALVSVLVFRFIRLIFTSPDRIHHYLEARREEKGYQALSQGIIASGYGDMDAAHRLSEKARKLLPEEPLVLLLEAQAAQIEGKTEAARAVFERMLSRPDTKLLGLRGLYTDALRRKDLTAARSYASEAQRLSPALSWAGRAVMEDQAAAHDFKGALQTLEQNVAARLIDEKEGRRLRAVLLTAWAMEVGDRAPAEAETHAKEAHRLDPAFVPAALIAAHALISRHDIRRATRLIEETWRLFPHPELGDLYLHVRPGDSAHDRLKRAQQLEKIRPHEREALLLVARAALDAGEFTLARETLARVLRLDPTRRAFLLMAELDDREEGGGARVRAWLARAVHAPRDPAWTADGVVSPHWQPISPITGRLDAFEWRVPLIDEGEEHPFDLVKLSGNAMKAIEAPATVHSAESRREEGEVTPSVQTSPSATHAVESKDVSSTPASSGRMAHGDLRPGRADDPAPFRPDDPGADSEGRQEKSPFA